MCSEWVSSYHSGRGTHELEGGEMTWQVSQSIDNSSCCMTTEAPYLLALGHPWGEGSCMQQEHVIVWVNQTTSKALSGADGAYRDIDLVFVPASFDPGKATAWAAQLIAHELSVSYPGPMELDWLCGIAARFCISLLHSHDCQ